jgi:hypothetical protein
MKKRDWQLSEISEFPISFEAHVATGWRDPCESFLEPLIQELKAWLSRFSSDNTDTRDVLDELEELSSFVGAIACEFGYSSLLRDWRRTEVWMTANVGLFFCTKFIDEARQIHRATEHISQKFEYDDAFNGRQLADQLRIIHLPRYIGYLESVLYELRSHLNRHVNQLLPNVEVNTQLCQVTYMGEVFKVTPDAAFGLNELVLAKGNWVSWIGLGFPKPSAVKKSLPKKLQELIATKSGKGYRLKLVAELTPQLTASLNH